MSLHQPIIANRRTFLEPIEMDDGDDGIEELAADWSMEQNAFEKVQFFLIRPAMLRALLRHASASGEEPGARWCLVLLVRNVDVDVVELLQMLPQGLAELC